MELLILLSAILTTLTGAATGGRLTEAQAPRSASVCRAQPVAAVAVVRVVGHAHLIDVAAPSREIARTAPVMLVRLVRSRLYLDRPRT